MAVRMSVEFALAYFLLHSNLSSGRHLLCKSEGPMTGSGVSCYYRHPNLFILDYLAVKSKKISMCLSVYIALISLNVFFTKLR